jgi:hypothetical protein
MEATMATAETIARPETKPHALIASDRVEGTPVYRTNGEKIGTIQRLMIDKISGSVAYAVLRYGGLLGIGEKHMPLPWGKLKFEPLMHGYQVDMSDDEFAKAPSYAADKEFDWGDRSQEMRLHDYYRARPYWGSY